jgi:hypothetical protein
MHRFKSLGSSRGSIVFWQRDFGQFTALSNNNRYTMLSDDSVYGNADEDMELRPKASVSQLVLHPSEPNQQLESGQDGWGDDDIVDAFYDDTDFPGEENDGERRRKVSQGQRGDRNTYNLTFAFQPMQTNTPTLGRGRGGGLGSSGHQNLRLSSLTPIQEVPETATAGTETLLDTTTVTPPTENPEPTTAMFTFRVQLTWGLDPGPKVNLPTLFRDWVQSSSKYIPDFALFPFHDEKGQTIDKPEQVPDDNPEFFREYYYNHRVLNHGNLTGMVHFRYLAKFKSATLVVCGFLVGAHPGHLRREDAKTELRQRLELEPDFPFQLSSRTISVRMISDKDSQKYSFPAVAIETSVR